MSAFPFDPTVARRTLFTALLESRKQFGAKTTILEDPERNPLTYDRLMLATMVLGRKLARLAGPGERVGVFLPNVQGVAIVFFALLARGRIPAMLNFTAGVKNLRAACELGGIRTIVTARRFIEQAKLDDVLIAMAEGRDIVYLEDIRKSIGSLDKFIGVLQAAFARAVHKQAGQGPDDAAVLLFTSGSEGAPKGVILTNANLVANVRQIVAHIGSPPLGRPQIVLNPLPVFHCYGLTGGLLVGLLTGMKVVLYPSPLHYRQVPKLAREVGASILFGTDTFLQGYARAAGEGDLATVRIVVAGAERIKDETRAMWDRFGTVILEGYGATECAPVIAVNQTFDNRPGTVGRILPGMEWRVEPVEGIAHGGRFLVKGPNVMKGYLLADRPGEIVEPVDGWHDTGDIVTVDEGVVTIRGRAKRFAKIGGEMVSLAAVETIAQSLWPGVMHVVVSLPDPRKGEQLVLVTEQPDADREALAAHARREGFPELWAPKAILVVAGVPVLGSGKVDFAGAVELARRSRPLL